ncbi:MULTISPECIES: Trp biosynthesis-associated membrane protein [unclassified Nocardioides]|uniref:Trp biosynthesis-associated membrane protein n=1 Tax=unclassified Nocardioides TaxID=2615069 RepID=UPI003614DEB9
MADATTGRRRTFGPVALLGLAAGGLAAVAGTKPAVEGEGEAARATSSMLVSFDAHLPLVTSLGLVVLACWGVLLVTRGRVRRAVAALATLAGAGALVAALAAYSQVPDQLRDELALVGIADPDLSRTAWYWAAVAGTVLATIAGALAFLWCPSWPEMGTRYDAPGSAEPAPVAPAEEQSNLDLWKAMDEGRDPTA